jgi:hypothetical protein
MYFGRDEDDMAQQHNAQMEESILSANGFGNLEASARDAVRQVMDAAGIDDLSDVQNAIRTGAMRVSFLFLFLFSPRLTEPPARDGRLMADANFLVLHPRIGQLGDMLARYA